MRDALLGLLAVAACSHRVPNASGGGGLDASAPADTAGATGIADVGPIRDLSISPPDSAVVALADVASRDVSPAMDVALAIDGAVHDTAWDQGGICPPGGAAVEQVDNATQKASGFEDGSIAPFTVCTTQNPNYGRADTVDGRKCMKLYWTQVGYDGTRMDRGAEACSSLAFTKEGWYGFQFYLPSPGFPTDKTQAIAQIFAMGGCKSWAAMLEIRNDELWIVHRGNCVATPEYQVKLAGRIPRNAWNGIVMHFVASNQGAGGIEVWFAGAACLSETPTYRKMGINFAFGNFTADQLVDDPLNTIGLKFGMYNFDDANYSTGESRTIYYDNVNQVVGNPPNAFGIVDPTR